MRTNLIRPLIMYALLLICGLALFAWKVGAPVDRQDQSLLLNGLHYEIETLPESVEKGTVQQQLAAIETQIIAEQEQRQLVDRTRLRLFSIFLIVLTSGLLCWIYLVLLRPFKKLESFAYEMAKGNLNVPLPYTRSNPFGAFTWSFDLLRKDLLESERQRKQAEKDRKSVLATLSHDIKTPIASIRAYAEGLTFTLKNEKVDQKSQLYLRVLMKKVDEVTKLTDDLFLHALSDMEQLTIHSEVVSLAQWLTDEAEKVNSEFPNRCYFPEVRKELLIETDSKRLSQAFMNIIQNSVKYAPNSEIEVTIEDQELAIVMGIHDQGTSIQPEDVPFLTQRFYRGKNVVEQEGAGLGLYLSSYILVQTRGKLTIEVTEDRFSVYFLLKKIIH